MEREKVPYTHAYAEVMAGLTGGGLLLGSYDANRKANIMTIGWGSLGSMWGMPIWTVLVRPSRQTFSNIEHCESFTVNVPGGDLIGALNVCGRRSGRDTDKFAECDLTALDAGTVLAPIVDECPLVYECQVVHSNDVLPSRIADELLSGAYIDGDYHRMYYGKVLSALASPDAITRLSS
jgi:flavin reductase (DIM6/NTAB) family NADH-FMN oxidoreductase RutF